MTQPARVLALVTDAFGSGGGISQYNQDFFGALSHCPAIGQIDVVPRIQTREATDLPARVRQFRPHRNRLSYSMTAMMAAARRRPDVIFCGHLYMAPLAALLAKQFRATLIVQTHGIEVWDPPSAPQRAGVETADLVLAVSRDTRGHVTGWADLAPEKVVVLPNTVSDAYSPGDGGAIRAKLGLGDKRVLLTISRLDARQRYKGQDRVIPLIQPLRDRGHDVVYVVVGAGDDLPRLQTLAASCDVTEHVRFLGEAPGRDLPDLYRAADLYLMPSSGEGFGIVFLEAMACGTPAMGLAAGGAADALCDGELGVAVDEGQLLEAVDASLGAPRPDSAALAAKVQARFGEAAFRRRVDQIISGIVWSETDSHPGQEPH